MNNARRQTLNFCSTALFLSLASSSLSSCDNYFFSSKKSTVEPEIKLSISNTKPIKCRDGTSVFPWSAPSRSQHIQSLKTKNFDVLVIGGGCVGCGAALDAQTRSLSVALVERNDFSSGTSSRSTKLIHGGVRYLEAAVKGLDIGQYRLVKEALTERGHMLRNCPYLARAVPIMVPCEHWYDVPMYWFGCKLYDFIAGKQLTVPRSSFMGKSQARYSFPMLQDQKIYGAVVYYDGQMNDARYALLVALTAAQSGATVANHVNIEELTMNNKTGRINGAIARDMVTGERFRIKAKSVVNATGPFSDELRHEAHRLSLKKKEDELPKSLGTRLFYDTKAAQMAKALDDFENIVVPAAGIHVMLPDHFSPDNMGLIVPETKDGRVLFFLPWEGGTLCGTTDSKSEITMRPRAKREEVEFVLAESSKYLNKKVQPSDVLAAWSGIRPLVKEAKQKQKPVETEILNSTVPEEAMTDSPHPDSKGLGSSKQPIQLENSSQDPAMKPVETSPSTPKPKKDDTKSISREHVIEVSDLDMITVVGGKWTTYRQMAEDAIDKLIEVNNKLGMKATPCVTKNMMLIGSDRANIVCAQRFDQIRVTLREKYGFDRDIATHLTKNYGTRALQIAEIVRYGYPGRDANLHPKRLIAKYPVLEAEIVFAVEQEYCLTAEDFLLRRCRLGFVDAKAAKEAVPNVVYMMGKLLRWNEKKKAAETKDVLEMLETMNVSFDDEEDDEAS